MIRIICLGKIKEDYLKTLINDYQQRICKYHKLEIIELKDFNDLTKEKELISKYLNKNEYLIIMDKDGKNLNSMELAAKIDETFLNFSTLTFVIGSSEGMHNDLKKQAHILLSFGQNTFPHGLFRGLLLEQIYRSFKILNNETYHK